MNFGQLKAVVKSYLNRNDLDSYIPDFINVALRKIEQEFNLNYMKTNTTGTITDGTGYIAQPTEMKGIDFIRIIDPDQTDDQGKPLIGCNYEIFINLTRYEKEGEPTAFSLYNENIYFYPIPDKNYSYELSYYKYTPFMTSDNDTNWMTENQWFLLLYGALIEAEPFLMNDERMLTWKALYDDGIRRLINHEIEKSHPRPWVIKNGVWNI